MIIVHDLIPGQKGKRISVELFPLATEMYEEFDRLGMIDRLKSVKQLGLIRVAKKLEKSRYDYAVLQLYYHSIIRDNIQFSLEYSYGGKINLNDFSCDHELDKSIIGKGNDVTVADVIQMMVFLYNVGHFYNTFVASRALIMLSENEAAFRDYLKNASSDIRIQQAAQYILEKRNYQRIHLLNSLLVLEHCDGNKRAVKIARELILSYIRQDDLPEESKLRYCYDLFRKVRTMAFVSYDLQIAGIPFEVDMHDEKGLAQFFYEYLAWFNNNDASVELVYAIGKLLNTSMYNEPKSVISTTRISQKIMDSVSVETGMKYVDYYDEFWKDRSSPLNRSYSYRCDFDSVFLKLTFDAIVQDYAEGLFYDLAKQKNIRAGYYLRQFGEMTLISSIRKNCSEKPAAAFRSLRKVVSYLRAMHAETYDPRYVIVVKYFLHYLFAELNVKIIPVLDDDKCVICTKGNISRIAELKKLLGRGTDDEKHEVNAMIKYLETDKTGDITITVSGSTVVYKDRKSICEFDGIIIYPNRTEKQVVLIEAKNTRRKPGYGENCLRTKLMSLDLYDAENQMYRIDNDAYYVMTV